MERISKNKIKHLRSLRLKKNRDLEQSFLIEGEKMVLEAVAEYASLIQEIYVLKESNLNIHFPAIFEISTSESEQISSFKTPNKCLALLKYPKIEPQIENFTLVLDQIQDPGNLGTIIRLADWYGLSKIVCSNDTVDCFNPKVIQASMGSIFRIQLEYVDLENYLKAAQKPIFGALLNGENVYKTNLPDEAILIMGNEGNGISDTIQQFISHQLTIPRFGKAESLNVASATGILLSEFHRNK
ncbi:MAG: RNA methyltransferase [Crocinitomicaceae bacterium]